MTTVSIRDRKIRQVFLPLHGLSVTAPVGQGLAPGLMGCLEIEGHVQVEPTHKRGPFRSPIDAHQETRLDFSLTSQAVGLSAGSTLASLDPAGHARDPARIASSGRATLLSGSACYMAFPPILGPYPLPSSPLFTPLSF
jgi:hypothetical protein